MGYSKWRKILTILMIISICFTLFSKVSKVFATIDTNAHNLLIYGTYYDLYYDYITSNYNYYTLLAVQEYKGRTSNTLQGYNRLYLVCSNSEFYLDKKVNNYSDGTYLNLDSFASINNGTFSYFVADSGSIYSQRFNYANTVANFNNCPFDPNASSGYHNFASYNCFQYNNESVFPNFEYGSFNNNYNKDTYDILECNFDLKDNDNNIVIYGNNRKPPELVTSQNDLENLTFDGLSINSWGFSDIDFYLLIYDRTLIGNDYNYVIEPAHQILLNKNSTYFQPLLSANPEANCVYWVPISDIGLQFAKNGIYEIRFGIRKYNYNGGTGGGGFRGDDFDSNTTINYDELYNGGNGAFGGYAPNYYYEYIGDNYVWEIDSSVSQATIDEINNLIKLTEEQRRHYEENNINSQTDLFIRSGIFRENNSDITSDGFNGIFTRLYNGLNSTPQRVSLTIPFTNTPMEIDPQATYNGFGENNTILSFYQISIYAIVSLYILKDIAKIIQDIKTGDIATKTDTNIKANML